MKLIKYLIKIQNFNQEKKNLRTQLNILLKLRTKNKLNLCKIIDKHRGYFIL